jgi:hypothetical protein
MNCGGTPLASYLTQMILRNVFGLKFKYTVAHTDKQEIASKLTDCTLLNLSLNTLRLGETGDEIGKHTQGFYNYFNFNLILKNIC